VAVGRHIEGPAIVLTPRLLMRPLTAGYLPEMLDLYADPRVTRFLKPLDEDGHLARLRETERLWASRGYGRAAILERPSGRFLGRGGLHYWAQFDEVEVGWALRADSWGRGYATEAGSAWVQWAFAHLDVPYVTAYIAHDNMSSRAVADRLGMSVLREDVFHGRLVSSSRRTGRRRPARLPGPLSPRRGLAGAPMQKPRTMSFREQVGRTTRRRTAKSPEAVLGRVTRDSLGPDVQERRTDTVSEGDLTHGPRRSAPWPCSTGRPSRRRRWRSRP
jgi:RimJ/RimL family protein N-acetyltransferase